MNDPVVTCDYKALYKETGLRPQEVFKLEQEASRRILDKFRQEAQLKVYSCTCRSAWCEHCSKFCATSETIRTRLADMAWDKVRQVVLTVSRETPAAEAMESIRKNRAIPKLIKNLGLKDKRWLWVLEFHADGYPHWHLFIENRRGRIGMIGKDRIQTLWKRGNVWESYPKDDNHWKAITGYHRKAGYFAGESKAHQLTLPEYLMEQSRVRKFGANFSLEAKKIVSREKALSLPGSVPHETMPPGPTKPRVKRVQRSYEDRLSACNTTCKVEKNGSWLVVNAPGSAVRRFASECLEKIDFQTFNGSHGEIVDFIISLEEDSQ